MKLPVLPVALAVGAASGIWFAFITFLAYRAGSNWEVLYGTILRSGKIAGLTATGVVILIAAFVFFRRRRRAVPEQ
jgi:membrane protein DedA with SNARE-associated domain